MTRKKYAEVSGFVAKRGKPLRRQHGFKSRRGRFFYAAPLSIAAPINQVKRVLGRFCDVGRGLQFLFLSILAFSDMNI